MRTLSTKERLEKSVACIREMAKIIRIRPESRRYSDLLVELFRERDELADRLPAELCAALYGVSEEREAEDRK